MIPRWMLAAAVIAAGAVAPTAGAHSSCANADLSPSAETDAQVAAATLCEMNVQRLAAGLAPLRRQRQLDRSASYHAQDMASFRYFEHQRPGEPSLLTRIRATGYFARVLGGVYTENLADAPQGHDDAAAVVDAWMASHEHRLSLLTEPFRDVGIAIEQAPVDPAFYPDMASTLYVVDFGRRYVRHRPRRCSVRSRHHGGSRRHPCPRHRKRTR